MKRGIAVLMFAIVLFQVVPVIADVLSPSPNPETTAQPTPEPSVVITPTQSPTASASGAPSATPQSSGSYTYISASDSPTPEPTLSEDQDVVLRIPHTFPVDPRATSVKVSPVNVYSSSDVLVCISTNGNHLWLSNTSSTVLIHGNNTKFLAISGEAADVTAVLNSGQGLRVAGNPRVQGTTIFTRAAVVTRQTVNTALCADAPKAISSAVNALGLGMNTVKNPVPIR